MHEQFLRTEMVLGQPALERLQSAHVAVFGLGGVGSYAAETTSPTSSCSTAQASPF